MKINRNLAKTGVLFVSVAHAASASSNAIASSKWGVADQRASNSAMMGSENGIFNLDDFIRSGKVNINKDAGVVKTHLSPSEVASSPVTKLTQGEPVVMGVFDGANNIGSIQIINMKRHADGSATLYQRFFSPYDFDKNSNGGEMSQNEFAALQNRFGGNPFDQFKSQDATYRHSFIKIMPHAVQTAMGIAMQRYGARLGLYSYLEPQVRTWTTTSGGMFRKKVTTHVRAHFKPHWYVATPADIGQASGNATAPAYRLPNGKSVVSGVLFHEVNDFGSNFKNDRVEMFYDKKSERSWTGIGMIAIAAGIGALTGGLGLTAMGPVMTAAAASGAVAGYATINGNTDFSSPVGTNGWLDFEAVSHKDSLKSADSWAMKWRDVMRDGVNAGPTGGGGNNPLHAINAQFEAEKQNWDATFHNR